jgi:hypothetical protein
MSINGRIGLRNDGFRRTRLPAALHARRARSGLRRFAAAASVDRRRRARQVCRLHARSGQLRETATPLPSPKWQRPRHRVNSNVPTPPYRGSRNPDRDRMALCAGRGHRHACDGRARPPSPQPWPRKPASSRSPPKPSQSRRRAPRSRPAAAQIRGPGRPLERRRSRALGTPWGYPRRRKTPRPDAPRQENADR